MRWRGQDGVGRNRREATDLSVPLFDGFSSGARASCKSQSGLGRAHVEQLLNPLVFLAYSLAIRPIGGSQSHPGLKTSCMLF